MAEELRASKSFLWVDGLAGPQRQQLYAQLRQGEYLIEHLESREEGKSIKIHDGMVHHWLGVIFIPGATLHRTLLLVQDYDNHAKIYKPDVRRSKLLERRGNDFKIYLQLYKKTLRTVVLNAEFDVHYSPLGPTQFYSRSYSTRIAEVENFDEPDEREKPVGHDHGYLWRLYSYWRFQQAEGGVYVQLESIGLTRGVPFGLGWLINPLVKRIPRESLTHLLISTRTALLSSPRAVRWQGRR